MKRSFFRVNIIFFLPALLVTAVSCKKKDKEPEKPSAREILSERPWNLYLLKGYDEFGNYIISYDKNDTYDFRTDGTVYVETETGWSYTKSYTVEQDGNNISVIFDGISEYKVLLLEDNKLILSRMPSGAKEQKKSPYTYDKKYFKR